VLILENVIKHYPVGGGEVVKALDGVSMTIERGELAALYGPSGSGKTTLLDVIAGLVAPDAGKVLVDGRDIVELSTRDAQRYRRVELGYVTQSLDLTVGLKAIDNAALKLLGTRANRRQAREQVAPLLKRLGLEERLRHYPHQLSAGQRQRVLIARALSTSPGIVVADEPTGNLDSKRSQEVLELLTEVCRERNAAMLLVTHDPNAAAFATRVHTLRDGHLILDTPPASVPAAQAT
jgi:putative ABC transport system ATP-binding protein